jgi:hypothetical protein
MKHSDEIIHVCKNRRKETNNGAFDVLITGLTAEFMRFSVAVDQRGRSHHAIGVINSIETQKDFCTQIAEIKPK